MLKNIPPQRIIWPPISILQKLRNPALEVFKPRSDDIAGSWHEAVEFIMHKSHQIS